MTKAMKKSDTTIILVDDLLESYDPLVIKLKEVYIVVELFKAPQKALDYISNNLNSKIIVLLDIKLSHPKLDGHIMLEKIREMSFLIPVILWSNIDERKSKFSDFINNKAFAFVRQTAGYSKILEIVKKAEDNINLSVGGAIQEWVNLQDKKNKDAPYLITACGKQYTLNQLLNEVRQQTTFGKELEKDLVMLTIDLLLRGKKELKGLTQ